LPDIVTFPQLLRQAGWHTAAFGKVFHVGEVMGEIRDGWMDVGKSWDPNVCEWIENNHDQPFFVYYAPNAVHEPIVPNSRFSGSPYGKYGDFIGELDWSVGLSHRAPLRSLSPSFRPLRESLAAASPGYPPRGLLDRLSPLTANPAAYRAGVRVRYADARDWRRVERGCLCHCPCV
jgi:hypothetical protein